MDAKAMIACLDIAVATQAETAPTVIAVKYADASELCQTLEQLMPGYPAKISVDARSNSLVVQTSPEYLFHIQSLVSHLDRKL